MLVVRNADVPGVIGNVATALGGAGVNIDDMDVGRSPSGEAAMMAIATSQAVPDSVVAAVRALPDIIDARAIELD
jgi:L-serine deaminase